MPLGLSTGASSLCPRKSKVKSKVPGGFGFAGSRTLHPDPPDCAAGMDQQHRAEYSGLDSKLDLCSRIVHVRRVVSGRSVGNL